MFSVDEVTAAIRAAFDSGGELSAVVELRRHFPLITDNEQARDCVRTIAGWKPLPPKTASCTQAAAPATGDPVLPTLSAPNVVTCPDCGGDGRAWVARRGGNELDVICVECFACGGTGKLPAPEACDD